MGTSSKNQSFVYLLPPTSTMNKENSVMFSLSATGESVLLIHDIWQRAKVDAVYQPTSSRHYCHNAHFNAYNDGYQIVPIFATIQSMAWSYYSMLYSCVSGRRQCVWHLQDIQFAQHWILITITEKYGWVILLLLVQEINIERRLFLFFNHYLFTSFI